MGNVPYWNLLEGVQFNGALAHLNFSRVEQEELISVILQVGLTTDIPMVGPLIARVKSLLPTPTSAMLSHISFHASKVLTCRTRSSIEAFLRDCTARDADDTPLAIEIRPILATLGMPSLQHKLLSRAIGSRPSVVREAVRDSIGPSVCFTGTSGDVGSLSISPDGNFFAAGSTCITDQSSMQYNRNCNLVFADIEKRTITEIADHWRPRVKPAAGANSVQSMHSSQDHRLFETVSSVDFSPDGSHLYSAGYDCSIQSYSFHNQGRPTSSGHVATGFPIDLLRTSKRHGLLATGSRALRFAINVWRHDGNLLTSCGSFSLPDASQYPERKLFPSCLQWGNSKLPNYLLTGFSSNHEGKGKSAQHGKLCLYDVEVAKTVSVTPSSGAVFDATWSPDSYKFVAATTGQSNKSVRSYGTNSHVRIYDPTLDLGSWKSLNVETDCQALDINDVGFCPYDERIITASATDGKIYIWDTRNLSDTLHILEHGDPLAELPPNVKREVEDTGVRYCGWNHSRTGLVTGSSDGVIKVWDIFRATEDAHTRDLVSLNSGVMSGAFSPDFSRFVVGETNGAVTLLDVGKRGQSLRHADTFRLLQADAPSLESAAPPESLSTNLPVNRSTCPIALCREVEALSVTEENAGDSGRWKDRIPEAMMAALSISERSNKNSIVSGMRRCTHCDAPARPRLDDVEQEQFPLCERCGFSCFRCGQRSKIGVKLENVACRDCGLEWTMGALGYELVKKNNEGANQKSRHVKEVAEAQVVPIMAVPRLSGQL
jgi:WD40 repeat protein